MLGVLGEVTVAALRTRHGELRLGMAVEAHTRWPAWREGVREQAGVAAPSDGYGAGTYILLNAASGPLDNDRALRAVFLPQERFLDARRRLRILDAALRALPNVHRVGAGRLRAHGTAYELSTRQAKFKADRVVVAVGACSGALLDRVDPELPVLPVVAAEGTAVALRPTAPVPPARP